MRLRDLHPRWASSYPGRRGTGILFDCPCSAPVTGPCELSGCNCGGLRPGCSWGGTIYVPFANPLDGREAPSEGGLPRWQREGDTFDTLTLSPSVHAIGHWHGHVKAGEVTAC